jgi:NADH-quinone oxidoreductase subunit A
MPSLWGFALAALTAAAFAAALLSAGGAARASWPQRAPVLGGAAPQTHAWSRFHLRYYPMTLLFIAFEMEMMFMYPWAVVFVEEGVKAMAEMGMFLAILSVGVLYGWREGAFRWQ